jgi:hypothetical protein
MANGEEMTTTPEQIEAVARAMCEAMGMDPNEVQTSGETEWPLWVEFQKVAIAAINAMRPLIRAEALEEAAKVANEREEERVGIPCPDGIKGCAVFHFRRETRPRNHIEIIAAIKALKEKKDV